MRSKTSGKEVSRPSAKEAAEAGWPEQGAMRLMLRNAAMRRGGRAVRLPGAGGPAEAGSGLSKPAVSKRCLGRASRRGWPRTWPMPTRPTVFNAIRRAGWKLRPAEVSKSGLECRYDIHSMIRLGQPRDLRRALARTTIIEPMTARVGPAVSRTACRSFSLRQVCRTVTRWRDATMALRRTAAGMLEAAKSFPRLKPQKQLPALKAALVTGGPHNGR